MPALELSQIADLMKLSAEGVTFAVMAIAIKYLWDTVKQKDGQIILERDKREELIKESIKASTAMLESTERIIESLQRLENGVLFNARTRG